MKPLSKRFFLISILGSYIIADIGILMYMIFSSLDFTDIPYLAEHENMSTLVTSLVVMGIWLALLIYGCIILLALWHKAWQTIQDGNVRMSPRKAIGLLFIPFFNFYWVYRVCYGYVEEYNEYLVRHNLNIPKLESQWFLGFSLLLTFAPIIRSLGSNVPLALVIQILLPITIIVNFYHVISDLCNAVNGISGISAGNDLTKSDIILQGPFPGKLPQ